MTKLRGHWLESVKQLVYEMYSSYRMSRGYCVINPFITLNRIGIVVPVAFMMILSYQKSFIHQKLFLRAVLFNPTCAGFSKLTISEDLLAMRL